MAKHKLSKAQQIRMDKCHLALRGKSYEQIFGVERAIAEKEKRSKALKGNAPWNKGLTKETGDINAD